MPGAETNEPAPNAASVALIDGDRVLLIKRAFKPHQHLWTLPGGRRDAGETIEACARRELTEELGLTVGGLHRALEQTLASGTYRLAVFASEEFTGTIAPSDEIADLRWASLFEASTMRTTSRLGRILAQAFSLFD
jgi:8-oxo-dGTP diphosphatase